MTEVSSSPPSQEKADTGMFLLARYALNHLQGNIDINANINFKTGNKSKTTIISVIKVKKSAYEAKAKDKYDFAVSVGLAFYKSPC